MTGDATLALFGRVDVLVNNASTPGGMVRGPLAEADDKTLLEDIDTKVVGYMRCAKAVAPHMQQRRWGRIINIGGLSGRRSGNISACATPPSCTSPRRSRTSWARTVSP